ncbi:hypothetical protein QBC34DRAFT_219226 [Podospora aff. communis PSN243]|uniref:Uncharacterized protein n=1 Tax=Podospora aff. communis PSN243 TaxID=3040156 RepID=A0AAV9H163_9PEZI|nr:hypothetical protein QBC34DRAFT_219226 [Podospora aff. communis PSN243]
MDSKECLEYGPMIAMETQQKTVRATSIPQLALRERATRAKTPVRRIFVAGSVVLLTLLGVSTLRYGVPCHGTPPKLVDEEAGSFSSRLRTATPDGVHDFLQKYFPDRHTVEDIPRTDAATTMLRLARRQDNITASSTPSPTPSRTPSTSPPPGTPSSSSPPPSPPPPRTEPSPPPPTTPSTTTRSSTTTTTTTSQPPPPPPPPPAVSGPTVTNPGTLTRSTTRDSPGGVDAQDSTRTTTRSSKMVVETITSTMSNGNVVVVTSTTYVPPDPITTSYATTVMAPSLHNLGARPRADDGAFVALAVVIAGVLLGVVVV